MRFTGSDPTDDEQANSIELDTKVAVATGTGFTNYIYASKDQLLFDGLFIFISY